jgi:hypothetical protein
LSLSASIANLLSEFENSIPRKLSLGIHLTVAA